MNSELECVDTPIKLQLPRLRQVWPISLSQLAVLRAFCLYGDLKKTAAALCLEISTVRTHSVALYAAFGVSTMKELLLLMVTFQTLGEPIQVVNRNKRQSYLLSVITVQES